MRIRIDEKMFNEMKSLAQGIGGIFKSFYLAGGTSIMFKYRHRMSTDLDFFNYKEFSKRRLIKKVKDLFPVQKVEEGIDDVSFIINGIRVTFVYFPFKNIKRTEKLDGIRIAHDYDLLLNKIYVAGRRIDPKDPYDFVYLYDHGKVPRDWNTIKADFERKFPYQSFEVFMGALLNVEDYPKLPKDVRDRLRRINEDIVRWTRELL